MSYALALHPAASWLQHQSPNRSILVGLTTQSVGSSISKCITRLLLHLWNRFSKLLFQFWCGRVLGSMFPLKVSLNLDLTIQQDGCYNYPSIAHNISTSPHSQCLVRREIWWSVSSPPLSILCIKIPLHEVDIKALLISDCSP